MTWVETNGTWAHPEQGSIAPLTDGKWQITYPTGERSEPEDDLEHAKRRLDAIWGGWVKDGDRRWTNPRFGTIFKDELGWYCRVKGEHRFSEKGPFQRLGFAIAEAVRLTPLASAVNTLQFADVFIWAICAGASVVAIGDWLVAAAFAFAGVAARMVLDNQFDTTKARLRRAFWECAAFLFAWKVGQYLKGYPVFEGAHLGLVPLAAGFVTMSVVRMSSMLACAVLRAAGPRRGVVWMPIPAELEPVPESPIHVRARELKSIPEHIGEILYAIRKKPDYEKLKETWIETEEGLDITAVTLRGLGRAPSLIIDDFKKCGLIVRAYSRSDPKRISVVLKPEVAALIRGEIDPSVQ
jgi:hypothetical protein